MIKDNNNLEFSSTVDFLEIGHRYTPLLNDNNNEKCKFAFHFVFNSNSVTMHYTGSFDYIIITTRYH